MRTRIIPAQITTVEDKIAGNLTITQIFLLMIPIFCGTLVYMIFPPIMHIAWYKVTFVLFVLIVSLLLTLRIKGKILLQWVKILMQYNLRPKYYLFNKNDDYLRTMDTIVFEKKQRKFLKKAPAKQEKETNRLHVSIGDLIRLEGLLANPKVTFSLKADKKGALNVAFKQI